MYRNVYWHHAVRSATAMFKRLVRRAIATAQLEPAAVAVATDDGLIHDLMQRDTTGLARRLRERRDRKSTRLNSSHLVISYAVFCLKKKKKVMHMGHTTLVH